MKFVTYDMEF